MTPEFARRLKAFFSRKPAVISLLMLAILLIASAASEWITNSKPVIGSIHGRIVVPAYLDYNWEDMGQEGAGVVDYREIKKDFSWSLWPLFKWDPFESDTDQDLLMSEPKLHKGHFMGTDVAGRDVFARLLYGTRISFIFAFSVWIITYFIGTIIGLMQGFLGGKVDLFGQRLVEVFSSIPEFYFLLLIITMLSPSLMWLIIFNSLFGWVTISSYMRGEALRNRSQAYSEAAVSLGASKTRVLFKHILPNSLIPLVTFSPFAIVGAILSLSALDLLGFGVPAPTPSWGELLEQASVNYQVAWWLALFPSLFMLLAIVSLNIVGEALRTAFDPRS